MRPHIRRPSRVLVAGLLACGGPPPAEPPKQESSLAESVRERDWNLVSLAAFVIDSTRRPTLRLDGNDRAGGFAGCNRFSGTYTMRGDSLTFGPVAATKMYCAATQELENAYLGLLGETVAFVLSDSTLTLRTPTGSMAVFRQAR